VFELIISYNFDCLWNTQKKERITKLLKERLSLLVGNWMLEKIDEINFCEREKIEDQMSEKYYITNEKYSLLQNNKNSSKNNYRLLIDKDILLSILIPGNGQANFDNLIIKLLNKLNSYNTVGKKKVI